MTRKSIALVSGFVALVVVIGALVAGAFHPVKATVALGGSAAYANKVVAEDRSKLDLSKALPSKALAYFKKVAVDDQAQTQGASQDVGPANAFSDLSVNAALAESARDIGLAIQAYEQTKDSRSLPSCIPGDVLAQLPSAITRTTRTALVPICGRVEAAAASSPISDLSENAVLAEPARNTGLAIQTYEQTKDSRSLPSCIPADVLAQLPSAMTQTIRTSLVPVCGKLGAVAATNPIPNGTYTHQFYQLNLNGDHYMVSTTMGQTWTEGRFTLSGDQMAFTETLLAECAAGESSYVYQWAFDGKGLTFTPVDDKCGSRKYEMTNGPWVYQGPAS
ncbi:MAG: hypothetical protein ABSF61_07815 [Anaerolineales bacterium]|jgi:hypothetical protein